MIIKGKIMPYQMDLAAEVVMTDTQGKVLISHKIMAGVNEVNLDLSNIAAGTYIIRIDGIKGTAVRKLIKQ